MKIGIMWPSAIGESKKGKMLIFGGIQSPALIQAFGQLCGLRPLADRRQTSRQRLSRFGPDRKYLPKLAFGLADGMKNQVEDKLHTTGFRRVALIHMLEKWEIPKSMIREYFLLPFVLASMGWTTELAPKQEVEPITLSIQHDTISLVLTSESVYYPFGKYPDSRAMHKTMGNQATLVRATSKRKTESQNQYIIFKGADSIKVFVGDRVGENLAEVVEAKIAQPGFKFKNGAEIGDHKRKIFELYFSAFSQEDIQKYRVLELISGLNGIWHYYTFKGEVLTKIEIKSDYGWEE